MAADRGGDHLWLRRGSAISATRTAAAVGHAFGWAFVLLGSLAVVAGSPSGIWTALVGGFLILAGKAESERMRVEHALAGRRVAELVSSPAVVVHEATTVEDAVAQAFSQHLHQAFPVVDADGRVTGLLTLRDARAVPEAMRHAVRVGAIARREPQLLVTLADPLSGVLDRPVFRSTGRAVVVDSVGRPLGVLSRGDVDRLLAAIELVQPGGRSRMIVRS